MGRVYCGPYAKQVGGEHEGYAAWVRPDGRVTSVWPAEGEEITARLAACACGWTGGDLYDPTDAGESEALEKWSRDHLLPMVGAAARDGWSAWLTRTASRAAEIVTLVTAGHPEPAVEVMARLSADVAAWAQVLDELVEERMRCGGEL
jgi:hypothetical protein